MAHQEKRPLHPIWFWAASFILLEAGFWLLLVLVLLKPLPVYNSHDEVRTFWLPSQAQYVGTKEAVSLQPTASMKFESFQQQPWDTIQVYQNSLGNTHDFIYVGSTPNLVAKSTVTYKVSDSKDINGFKLDLKNQQITLSVNRNGPIVIDTILAVLFVVLAGVFLGIARTKQEKTKPLTSRYNRYLKPWN